MSDDKGMATPGIGVGRLVVPGPHPDVQEETAVEHLQNLRQILMDVKDELQRAQADNYAPLVVWIERVEAADKRALKALVQLTRAGRLLAPGVRAVRP